MSFCENTKKILIKAGWKSERRINTIKYEEYLQSEGYSLNDYAKRFIAEFGELEIVHPAFKLRNKNEKTHFNPLIAANHIYYERVQTYEEKINEKFVVVGEAFNEHLTLMVSESGKLYGAYDDYLTLLGKDVYEGIDSICEGRDTIEIK